MNTRLYLLLLFIASYSYGQLGFCTGSKGDPIFFENFGSGNSYGPALPLGFTSYRFVPRTPSDGEYTISSSLNLNAAWHNAPDHTPDAETDGTNGRSLLVNADFSAGEFYKRSVNGLCINTTFEFSAWLMNVYDPSLGSCAGTGIPVDVTFEIWDATETTLLTSGSTGAINGSTTALWQQFGLTFTTFPGQTSVVLKMKNNGAGGCGNDLAIDDISFRSCGDPATVVSSLNTSAVFEACIGSVPAVIPLSVNISNANPHVFQWQQSTDAIVWTDIIGQNTSIYNLINPTQSQYIRVKIAQDAANLSNPFCYTLSDHYHVVIYQKPAAPVSNGDKQACGNESLELSVTAPANWYDAPSGGNLLLANAAAFTPTVSGLYYAEAFLPNLTCVSTTRTLIKLTVFPVPILGPDVDTFFCENKTVDLDAGIDTVDYLWSTGEISKIITVRTAGTYTATVTKDGCSNMRTFTVSQKNAPVISEIDTTNGIITIKVMNPGDFEYSLDGIMYQDSNVFASEISGIKIAYVRETNDCGFDSEQFSLIRMPEYFTPNNDGYHDTFAVAGLSYFPNGVIYIFNKFGKLIKTLTAGNPEWNGNFNGNQLPADDYWYRVDLGNGKEYTGHFALKR